MKVSQLFEAKMGKNGAILKGGYILQPEGDAEDTWVLKRIFEDRPLAIAEIIDTHFGDRQFLLKFSSLITDKKVSLRVNAGGGAEGMDDATFWRALTTRLCNWVESVVNGDTEILGLDDAKLSEMWVKRDTGIWLHRLNKDGTESGMSDAKRYYTSKRDAINHHNHMVDANPGKEIAHHLYMKGDLGNFKMKLSGKHNTTSKKD